MHIGEVAERTGLSLRTIRHYDEVGLLPAHGRTDGGFRLYTEDDLDRLNHVHRIKTLGFTLEEMTELLDILKTAPLAPRDTERAQEYLRRAHEARQKLARKLHDADRLIADLHSTLGQ